MTFVPGSENRADPPGSRRYRGPMQLLRDRRIALLVAGQAVNGIGSWCAVVALWGFASFRFDAGPGAIALLGLAWSLPPVLLGPLVGVAFAAVPIAGGLVTLWRVRRDQPAEAEAPPGHPIGPRVRPIAA